ncbi:MAG: NADH-quinone oxidoreductase subunit F [Planctomycetes bacterium]|nr:NADH-quinone oxidoreductase subunit F [Planctomycetota bacterium]
MVSPVVLIAVPLALAFIIPLVGLLSQKATRYVPVIAMVFNCVIALQLLPRVLQEPVIVRTAGFAPPFSIHLVAGPLGVGLALLVALIGLLVAIYAISYIHEGPIAKYHTLYLLLLTGATGMVLTGDLFNLFVFFEILCISSYALVGYRGDKSGIESSAKYLIQGALGSSLVLIGIGFIYSQFGTLSMADIARNVSSIRPMHIFISVAFLITGFGVEAAIFPLNAWLPDAHSSAPSSISAILSGLAIKAGLYAVARVIFTVFGAESILLLVVVVGVLTLLIGEMSAFSQDNIKRLLAYSSIGQIGLILFALGLASEGGVQGALFLVVSHAFAKATLFLSVGYMVYRTGSMEISSLDGMGKRMPLSSLCFTVGAFSLVGLPPFIGFPGKFMVIRAALAKTDMLFTVLTGIVLLGTVVEGAYFFRIVQGLFFRSEPENIEEKPEEVLSMPFSALLPVCLLAFAIIAVGIYPQLLTDLIEPAATDLLDRAAYIQHVFGG